MGEVDNKCDDHFSFAGNEELMIWLEQVVRIMMMKLIMLMMMLLMIMLMMMMVMTVVMKLMMLMIWLEQVVRCSAPRWQVGTSLLWRATNQPWD